MTSGSEDAQKLARGFGWSIYFMLGMVFTLGAIFAYVVWREAKKP